MSTKKQKKPKQKTVSLQEFTASLEPNLFTSGQNVIYAPKKSIMTSSWADEVEEYEMITEKERIVLPSAPRASRGSMFDENSVPRVPPFKAHLGNISYDIDDEDVVRFFSSLAIEELRLPRDSTNRLRGFGYIEFTTREDLLEALLLNERILRGRPIRITLGAQGATGGTNQNRSVLTGISTVHHDATPSDWRASASSLPQPPPPSTLFNHRPPYNHQQLIYPTSTQEYRRTDSYNDNYNNQHHIPIQHHSSNFHHRHQQRNETGRGFESFSRSRSMYETPSTPFYATANVGDNYGMDQQTIGGGNGPPPRLRTIPSRHDSEPGFNYNNRQLTHYHHPQNDGRAGSSDFRGGPNNIRSPHENDTDYGRHFGNNPGNIFHNSRYDERSSNWKQENPYNGGRSGRANVPPSLLETRETGNVHNVEIQPKYDRGDSKSIHTQKCDASPPRERKKLVILPRSKTAPTSSDFEGRSSIFGEAKPVDTAAREREIEKKIEEMNLLENKKLRSLRPKPELYSPPPQTTSSDGSTIKKQDSGQRFRRDSNSRNSGSSGVPPLMGAISSSPNNFQSGTGFGTGPSGNGGIPQIRRRRSEEGERDKDTNSEPEDDRDLQSVGHFGKLRTNSNCGTLEKEHWRTNMGSTQRNNGNGISPIEYEPRSN